MLKIRLKRTGRKHRPSYRIVVADSRKPRDGEAKEEIGWYSPCEDVNRVVYNKERLDYWVICGAQLTEAVAKLIKGKYQYTPYSGAKGANDSGEPAEQTNDPESPETTTSATKTEAPAAEKDQS